MAYDNGDEYVEYDDNLQRSENFLYVLLVGVLFCSLIWSFWYYCTQGCKTDGQQKDDTAPLTQNLQTSDEETGVKRLVVAEEIRPGLLLVHGNKQEIHNIVSQYDALRRQESLQQYGACAETSFTQQRPPPLPSAPPDVNHARVGDDIGGAFGAPPPYESLAPQQYR